MLAASSLQEALEEAAGAWAAHGHPAPVLSFAGSSALARQVEQGAPADLFISADEEWMDTLAGKSLLRADTRTDLLSNRLVLVTRKGGPVRALADLADGKLALADPAAVPAGKYARAALESSGQWQAVAAKVVPAENVRAALALVEAGMVDTSFVYITDANIAKDAELVWIAPPEDDPGISYVAVVVKGAKAAAPAYVEWLHSQAFLAKAEELGFLRPGH